MKIDIWYLKTRNKHLDVNFNQDFIGSVERHCRTVVAYGSNTTNIPLNDHLQAISSFYPNMRIVRIDTSRNVGFNSRLDLDSYSHSSVVFHNGTIIDQNTTGVFTQGYNTYRPRVNQEDSFNFTGIIVGGIFFILFLVTIGVIIYIYKMVQKAKKNG